MGFLTSYISRFLLFYFLIFVVSVFMSRAYTEKFGQKISAPPGFEPNTSELRVGTLHYSATDEMVGS
jgi:hypothetical protein